MPSLYFDPPKDDARRRRLLYDGEILVLPPSDASIALCGFAQEMLEEAFAPHDPRQAQFHMPVEEFVARFAPVKPKFIHDPKTKQLVRDLFLHEGCDPETTYQDVPRLRGVTSDGYLTSGVGYAHHPHRDTWYSAPMCQLNWWLPIFPFVGESAMAFHPKYFAQGVRNGSSGFNYYEWNAVGRRDAAKQIKADTRKQPKPEEEVEISPDLRIVPPVGGIILFSGAQLHSAVPNTAGETRFSIDVRTVHLSDVAEKTGAPNVDSSPTGTSLRDFLRVSDLAAMPEDVVALYDDTRKDDGELVFRPEGA